MSLERASELPGCYGSDVMFLIGDALLGAPHGELLAATARFVVAVARRRSL